MGGHPYWYFVPHEKPEKALAKLREREFRAGRYYPASEAFNPAFDKNPPGAQHDTIDDAMNDAMEDGTRSILDISEIGTSRARPCVAAPLDADTLKELYGTDKPTHAMVEGNMDFLDTVSRGHCVYIVIYEKGKPKEIYFGGYSFD